MTMKQCQNALMESLITFMAKQLSKLNGMECITLTDVKLFQTTVIGNNSCGLIEK